MYSWGAGIIQPEFSEAVFYITCRGWLVNLPLGLALMDPGANPETSALVFNDWVEMGYDDTGVVCTKDEGAKTISCGKPWYTAVDGEGDVGGDTTVPFWYQGSGTLGTPLAMGYEEVVCPCAY